MSVDMAVKWFFDLTVVVRHMLQTNPVDLLHTVGEQHLPVQQLRIVRCQNANHEADQAVWFDHGHATSSRFDFRNSLTRQSSGPARKAEQVRSLLR